MKPKGEIQEQFKRGVSREKEVKMKCPLLKITRPGLMTEDAHPHDDCLEKECAWWDSIIQTCLIYSLHADLAYIGARLQEIASKIPLGG